MEPDHALVAWGERIGLVAPSFSVVNAAAATATLTMPKMDWQPFVTLGVWAAAATVLGCFLFSRRDF